MGIVIVIHVIACFGLIFFILIQSGRGGGLIESFSSADSIFGTKTNTFLTKTTTALAIIFFITCLVLAFLSVQQNKSIVEREVRKQPFGMMPTQEVPQEATGAAQETAGIDLTPVETTEALQEITDATLPEVTEEVLEEQTQAIDQTQENNAATEEAAAIQ